MRRHLIRLFAPLAAIVACLFTTPAHAAGGLAGIDLMTATVFQEGQSSFSGLGLRFRVRNARLLENVEILPTVEYWRNSSSLDAFGLNVVRRDATLGADIRWIFEGTAWRAYAGGGMAVHFLSSKVRVGAPVTLDEHDSLTKGGLTLLGGVWFGDKSSKIVNFLEAKGHLVGGYRQVKLNMGIGWNR